MIDCVNINVVAVQMQRREHRNSIDVGCISEDVVGTCSLINWQVAPEIRNRI